jgi:hypothetical protein
VADHWQDEKREWWNALLDILYQRFMNLYHCDGKDEGQLFGDLKDLCRRCFHERGRLWRGLESPNVPRAISSASRSLAMPAYTSR